MKQKAKKQTLSLIEKTDYDVLGMGFCGCWLEDGDGDGVFLCCV